MLEPQPFKASKASLQKISPTPRSLSPNSIYTQVTKAGVAELQKALPKCDILSNPTK